MVFDRSVAITEKIGLNFSIFRFFSILLLANRGGQEYMVIQTFSLVIFLTFSDNIEDLSLYFRTLLLQK